MSNIAHITQNSLDSIAQKLMGQLVNFSQLDESRILVNTPVVYPNGSSVAIEVILNSDGNFLVSDGGSTYAECLTMQEDTARRFKISAVKWAEHVGAEFDGEQIYFIDVPAKDLDAEVVMLAYCSQMCLIEVQKFVAKDIEKEIKLVSHKPLRLVKREVRDTIKSFNLDLLQNREIKGENMQWKFDNAISLEEQGKKVYLEVLPPQEDAIHRAVAKFYDVGENVSKDEVTLAAVIDNIKEVESGNIELLKKFGDVLSIENKEFSNEVEKWKAAS